jgi:hypothetical protein
MFIVKTSILLLVIAEKLYLYNNLLYINELIFYKEMLTSPFPSTLNRKPRVFCNMTLRMLTKVTCGRPLPKELDTGHSVVVNWSVTG